MGKNPKWSPKSNVRISKGTDPTKYQSVGKGGGKPAPFQSRRSSR